MTHTVSGIVLRRFKSGEADRMLIILTRELGKVRAVARSVRKTQSRLAGHLEPWRESELRLAEGRGEVWTVAGARLVQAHELSGGGLAAAARAAELTDRLAPEGESSPELYDLFRLFLEGLAGASDPESRRLHYEFRLLAWAGLFPETEHCVVCGRELSGGTHLSAERGGVLHAACLGEGESTAALTDEQRALLQELRRGEASELRLLEAPWDYYISYMLERRLMSDDYRRQTEVGWR